MPSKPTSNISEDILAAYEKVVSSVPGVERKGATMPYTSVSGNMSSFIDKDGTLALRLDADAREAFIKKHKTKLHEAHGAVMKEYVTVPVKLLKDTQKMEKYFRQSYEYVSSLKAKPTTKPKKAASAKEKTATKTKASAKAGSNRNPEVDEYLAKKAHPMNAEIQRVREIILGVHPEMQETIKWQSPTFIYKGNMASYFMTAKKHVSLMFHKGALINDKTGLLEGEGKEGRTAKWSSMQEIEKRKKDLETVVKEWIKLQDKQ